jgi:uncharacterized repeat protein (TIGR01451 family)
MLLSSPLLPRACSAGRKFGSVAFVALVVAFFQLSAVRVEAQGCGISGSTVTCTSHDVIQTPIDHTTPLPHSSPTVPTSNYPSTINVPYTGTVTGVQVSLTQVTSLVAPTYNDSESLFWAQAVLVSPSGKALVFLGGLGTANDPVTNLPMVFKDGAPSAPYLPPTGGGTSLPGGTSTAIWEPTDILDDEGKGGGVLPTLPGTSYSLTSANWPQPDGSATLSSTFSGVSALGGWKLYLADWNGDQVTVNGWGLTLTIDQTAIGTTTSISGGTNPATPGTNVTYTATVSASAGTPAGTVAFTANGSTISGCSAVAMSGGAAHCTVALSAGTAGQCESTTVPAFPTVCQGAQNTIAASYSGENDGGGDFGPSSSSGYTQWVGAPTANLTHSGNQWCNSAPLYVSTDGTANAYPSFIPVSGYTSGQKVTGLSVQLNGISSTDGIYGQFLLVAPSNQNLDFLDKGFPLAASSAMNLTFTDTAGQKPNGSTPPTDGSSWEAYAGSQDIFPTANPAPPSPIPPVPGTITYPPSSSSNEFANTFNGATANGDWALYLTTQNGGSPITLANGWCITLTPSTGIPTTTTVTSSQNPAPVGQAVSYTATVKAGSNPVTSGTVTFFDNGTAPTGTNVVSLNSSGQATFTTSSLFDPVNIRSSTLHVLEGDHTITASFGGTSNADPSSASLLQRIDNPTTLTGSGQNYQACNNTGTTVGVYLGDGTSGPFTPNPSIINVAGLPGTVNSMKLTLKNFSTFGSGESASLESLIAGPAGALDFFSKTGTLTAAPLTVGDYVFSDSGTSTVPNSTFGPGTYKPTSNATPDTFTSGYYTAPSFTYAAPAGSDTFATKFSNSSPNGMWSLFFNAATQMNTAGAAGGWCMNFVQNAVAVSATASHSGNGTGGDFVQSDSNAKITATIANNSGPGPTGAVSGDPLTVTDTLDSAFTYKNSTGSDTGWTCQAPSQTVTCTNTNSVAQGASSKLVINVSVSSSASGSKTNKFTVSGAGVTSITSASDTIPIDANATLGVSLLHSGTFTQGQTGEWDITVNNSATSSSTGIITVTDVLPTGYTYNSSSSTGSAWSCSGSGTVTCTTTASISAGSSSMISLHVNIPAASPTSVSNSASVYGGGDTVHTSLGTAATSGTDTVTVVQIPASVGIPGTGSGNHQSATILTAFSSPLAVLVADAAFQPIQGVTVTFTAPVQTGASATFAGGTTTAVTDASGRATSAALTANSHAGTYLLTAGAPGATSASFQLTNTVGAPTGISAVGGGSQSTNDTAAFPNPLEANVTDAGGNPVSGVTVTFTAPPQTGASLLFAGNVNVNTAITDALGNATSAAMTANGNVGTYSVTASIGSAQVPFSLTNSVGAATQLVVTAPSTAYVGIPLQFTVTAEDAGGNLVTTNSDALQLLSSDGAAVLPSSPALTAGTATLIVTLNTPGSQTITASDPTASISAAPANITVSPVPSLVVNVNTDDAGTASNCTPNPTTSGPGTCSLRDALLEAATLGAANISFDSTVFSASNPPGNTITAAQTLIIPAYTNIQGATSGSGAALTNLVTVSGGGPTSNYSIFHVNPKAQATIANLNITNGNSNVGGAITSSGVLTIADSTVSGNSASNGGAIYTNSTDILTLIDSTISGNTASGTRGGGIYAAGTGTVELIESTISGNSVVAGGGGGGGGIYALGPVTLFNSTISGNSTPGSGGGIYYGDNATSLTLANSIVSGNSALNENANIFNAGSGILNDNQGNFYDTSSSTTPTNQVHLTTLDSHGGPTQTMVPVRGNAICGGLVSNIPPGITTDQRGFLNPNTSYVPATPCVDIGAVQTYYSLSFTTEPPTSIAVNTPMSPAPVVTLSEIGGAASSSTGTMTISDASTGLTATAPVTAGVATFSNLQISSPVTGDTLTATYADLPVTLTAESDPFTILGPPSLTLAVTHPAAFMQGATAEWDVTVGDAANAQPTSGTINLVDTLPTGYTLSTYDSTGGAWACVSTLNTVSCSTSASIATGGASVIRLMVNVPLNSPVLVTNTAVASGGGDTLHSGGVTASDINVPVQQVAASISPSSSTLSAAVGSAFSSLAVAVTDAGGVPVPGYSVVFTAPVSGPSGTFAGNATTVTISTDAGGVADPGAFTANTIANTAVNPSYTVTAQGSSLLASFTLTNTAGAVTQLDLQYLPDVFTTWPVTITVIPEDQYGNALSSFTDSLHFASSDPSAVLPTDGPLCGCTGSYQFSVTLNTPTAGTPTTITVTDTTTPLSTPAVATFNVVPPINLVVTTSDDPVLFSTDCEPQTTPGTGGAGACSLRDALNAASSGLAANITFDTSRMSSTTITLMNGALEIPNDARIIGPTTGGPITVSGNNASGVFQMTDQTAQGAIDGIAITGGFVNDASPNGPSGAAIYNNGTLWVDGSVISANTATSDTEIAVGGAIFSDNDLEISNSTITGNTVSGAAEAFGGGIFNLSYLDASNLTVSNNSAEATSPSGFAAGGGIFTGLYPYAEMDLDHSTISANSAQGPIDGSGDAAGGGIASINGEMWMEYSTIAGNSTTFGYFYGGGGVYCQCYQELYNNTITANASDTTGGGLLLDTGSLMVLSNSIISGNSGSGHKDFENFSGGPPIDLGGNLVHVNGINLTPLGNYGGPVKTAVPLPGSPAICNGLVANIPPGELLDERGFPNVNTLYLAPDSCVDSGAVQTNYLLTFTSEPPTSFFTTQAISPAPVVALTESGAAAPVGSAITMTDTASLLGGTTTANLSSGSASFSNLVFSSTTSNDLLTATLALNPALSPALNLTAQSTAFTVNTLPPVTLSAASLNFGGQLVGIQSPSQFVSMTNNTGATLSLSSILVTGPNASSFVFGGTTTYVIPGSCGVTLAAGASCLIHGHFTPTSTGPLSAAVTITHSASNSPQSISLAGIGVDPTSTSVSLSSTSLMFSPRVIGTNSQSQNVTLTNTGGAILSNVRISVTGPNASSFIFAIDCPRTVAMGASCQIHGHFTPMARGPLTATVLLTDSATDSPQSITLTGTGLQLQAASLSSTRIAFAGQEVYTTGASQSVTMTNTGDLALRITSIAVTGPNASSFVFGGTTTLPIAGSCGSTLAPGASCLIHGHFTPMSTGPLTAAVTITDNAGDSPQSITLTGTGNTPPAVTLTSTSLTFAAQTVGTTGASQSVTLTNTGGTTLLIPSILVTGPNASSFVFANSCGTQLAAGASCTIHGHFTPTSTGPLTAAVTITDNASDSPQSISLAGTGQ